MRAGSVKFIEKHDAAKAETLHATSIPENPHKYCICLHCKCSAKSFNVLIIKVYFSPCVAVRFFAFAMR
jgi:hypothetical protein